MLIYIWMACNGDIVSGGKDIANVEDTSIALEPSPEPSDSPTEPANEEPEEVLEERIVFTTIRNGGGGGVFIYSPEREEVVWRVINTRGKHWLDAQPSSDGKYIYVLEDNLFSPVDHSSLLVFDQSGLIEEHFFRDFHHTIAVLSDEQGEVIFTLEQDYLGQNPVNISDKVMRYRDGFSEPIFQIKDWVDYDLLENNFKVLANDDIDKSHANTIRFEPARNTLIVSFAGLNCIVELSLDGTPLHFYLGAEFEPFAMKDTSATIWTGGEFIKPHGARFDEQNTLWVISDTENIGEKSKEIQQYRLVDVAIENQETESENQCSLDTASNEEIYPSLLLQHQIPPPYEGMLPAAGGDLIPWNNGNIMANWGFSGVMEEVNLEGERIWMLETPIQESLGFFGTTTISFEN